jgi:hypothetical protein
MVRSIATRSCDPARTGANNEETVLTASAVRRKGIARLFSLAIPDDARLEAQPLAIGGVRLKDGSLRDLILQASMGNTVFAFDAVTGAPVWSRFLGRPITGTRDIDAWLVNVKWGILSTPVVDETAGLLYACTWISEDGTAAKAQHFLAALHLADGTLAQPLLNLEGAVYAPPGLPRQTFASAQRKQRAGLALTRNHVLIPFGTIAETSKTARGWLLAVDVDANPMRIAATWCSTVTGFGGGIWQSGAAPAIGPDGSIYVVTGNGSFAPAHGDYGESIVRLTLTTGDQARFDVASWWSPWTDAARAGPQHVAMAEEEERALPSNVSATMVAGHAKRLGLAMHEAVALEVAHLTVNSGAHEDDARIAALAADHMEDMNESIWADQDFGSGGAVYVESAGAVLAAGKDGILYTVDATALGNSQPADLTAERSASNYAKLRAPPILYTYFDPAMPPAPASPEALNKFVQGATRHLHGTALLFSSAAHGTMHIVGGENSALRAWSIAADGRSTYLAGSDEIASAQSPRPPGGMPGWSIALASNAGADGIVAAMIPYKDSNMSLSAGRFLIYDAQTFVANADGSQRMQVVWDSQDWGPQHAFTHPKFNRPIIWKGRIYRPSYDGRIDVYGLTP